MTRDLASNVATAFFMCATNSSAFSTPGMYVKQHQQHGQLRQHSGAYDLVDAATPPEHSQQQNQWYGEQHVTRFQLSLSWSKYTV